MPEEPAMTTVPSTDTDRHPAEPTLESARREAEHAELLALADNVERLNRTLRRERSYAALHYAA